MIKKKKDNGFITDFYEHTEKIGKTIHLLPERGSLCREIYEINFTKDIQNMFLKNDVNAIKKTIFQCDNTKSYTTKAKISNRKYCETVFTLMYKNI